ncbi:glycosyltransferase family 4 protein [Candidatus Aciduliprofundum boonei]|uniref:Glycosyl transferase group 1 n=1 Tax=Aciduliprofundum boonei (strain DSM 19572 / T469) TaxID=439481 RepID=D3TBX6_ACIB4|nr:glycosyltransferase family 4 protein [Candidatus Aciduliprofundum boonei]ADD08061.1 glycosyl transferase group 1 [Aciduliprofundum boonei T469]
MIIGKYPTNERIVKGGIESAVYGLVHALKKRYKNKIEISLISPNSEKDFYKKENDIEVKYISNPYRWQLLYAFRLKDILGVLKNREFTIVHLHGSSLLNLFTILYLLIKGIPFVVTIHGIVSIEHKNRFVLNKNLKNFIKFIIHSFVEYTILILSKFIIVDTEYVKKKLPFTNHKKVFVVPQGINEIFFNIEDQPIFGDILSVGVISPRKGYEYSIQAIAKLKNRFPEIHYEIIGAMNSLEQKEYYKKLRALIKKFKLENTVFIYPNKSKNFLIEHLKKAYIFILHSQEESQGIAFCEAMAAGKPIVATNVGGVPYVVKNEVTGFLSDYGDVKSFIENITKLLEDPQLRNYMSKNCRIEAKKYDWNKISTDIIRIYEDLVKKRSFHK